MKFKPIGVAKKAHDEGYQARKEGKPRDNPYTYTSFKNGSTDTWWATGYDKADRHAREMDKESG